MNVCRKMCVCVCLCLCAYVHELIRYSKQQVLRSSGPNAIDDDDDDDDDDNDCNFSNSV